MAASIETTHPARPTMKLAAFSPTAIAHWVACLSLLVCLFVPQTAESGNQPVGPMTVAAETARQGQGAIALIVLWPYLFALVTLALTTALVIGRPARLDRVLLMLPIGFSLVLWAGWVVMLFSDSTASVAAMEIAAIVVPLATIVALRMLWLCQDGLVTSAAAWGQGFLCVLAIFSLAWLGVSPDSQWLVGRWIAIGSAAAMMLASWTWITRARHDLLDREMPADPFQMSIQQLVAAITITAVALTYWRIFGQS